MPEWNEVTEEDIAYGRSRRTVRQRPDLAGIDDWKEITLSQLLGASSANPDPCDCFLHKLGRGESDAT